jgi:hypothetical protein
MQRARRDAAGRRERKEDGRQDIDEEEETEQKIKTG